MHCSLEISDVQFGVYDNSQVCPPLEHIVLIFPNLFCLMQANSSAVPYCLATFGPEFTSLPLKAEKLSLLYFAMFASVTKLMAQSQQYNLDRHIYANSQGFFLKVGNFHQALDTYQQMAKGLVLEVLCATFFITRGYSDTPKAIAERIDYLHQMLGPQNDEAICCNQHAVCKEYVKQGGGAALRFFQKAGN